MHLSCCFRINWLDKNHPGFSCILFISCKNVPTFFVSLFSVLFSFLCHLVDTLFLVAYVDVTYVNTNMPVIIKIISSLCCPSFSHSFFLLSLTLLFLSLSLHLAMDSCVFLLAPFLSLKPST